MSEKEYTHCSRCGGEKDNEGWCANYCLPFTTEDVRVITIKESSPPRAKVALPNGKERWVSCVVGPSGWQPVMGEVLAFLAEEG